MAEESNQTDYPFTSTGVKPYSQPIRLDKGEGHKGSLNYTAEFVPALALKNLSFEGEALKKPSDGISVASGSSVSSSDEEGQAVPPGITIKVTDKGNQRISSDSQRRGSEATGTTSNGDGYDVISSVPSTPVKTSTSKKDAAQDAHGVEMSNAELLEQRELISHLIWWSVMPNFFDNSVWYCGV